MSKTRDHDHESPNADEPTSPLLRALLPGHFSIGDSSGINSPLSLGPDTLLGGRPSLNTRNTETSMYLTRRLSDQQKPVLALLMERSEGESRFQSTTTKEIFDSVRQQASELCLQNTKSAKSSSMGAGSPIPPKVQDAAEGEYDAPALVAAAASRLRGDHPERRKSGATSEENGRERSNGSLLTRLVRYRDIDRLSSLDSPAILVRRHAVLMLLDPLRAVIMADRFIIIVPDGADKVLAILDAYISGWPSRKKDINFSSKRETFGYVPFEYLVYEAVLETVIAMQNQEYISCAEKTRAILHSIKDASLISLAKQEKMSFYKNQISARLSRCRQHRRALEELMNDDDSLALMNLSRLRHNPSLYNIPLDPSISKYHEDAEALFDSYQIEFSSLETKFQLLRDEFHNAEDLASLRLATSQNKLLFAESIVILSTVFLTTGGFIGGLYGMNLINHLEENDVAFTYVCIATVLFIFSGTYVVYKYFRRNGTFPRIFDAAYFNVGEWNA